MSVTMKTKRLSGEFRAKELFVSLVEMKIPQGTTENTTGHQWPCTCILEVTRASYAIRPSSFMLNIY